MQGAVLLCRPYGYETSPDYGRVPEKKQSHRWKPNSMFQVCPAGKLNVIPWVVSGELQKILHEEGHEQVPVLETAPGNIGMLN